MRRRILSMLLVLALAFGLVSCGSGDSVGSDTEQKENVGESTDENDGEKDSMSSTDKTDENSDPAVSVPSPDGEDEDDEESEAADYSDIIFDRSLTEGSFAVYFLNYTYSRPKASGSLGGGDSTLLITPDGTTILIDCNMSPITSQIVTYLLELGIEKLDYLMISHTDEDHVGGMNALLAYIEVEHVLVSESPYYFSTASEAGRMVEKAVALGASCTVLKAGDEMDFGDVHMKVYWPTSDYLWSDSQDSLTVNNGSLVAKFTYGESSFLFAGDLYMSAEAELVALYGDELSADVVKMNHHGHETSNSLSWLKSISPKLACGMACGVFSSTVLNRYTYLGAVWTLGYLDGSVAVWTAGDGAYNVQVQEEREETYYGVLNDTDGRFRVE